MNSRILSLQEAATILKVHPETLRRWDRTGKLPALKLGDRNDRKYKEEDVLNFIKTQTAESTYKDYQILPRGYGFDEFPDRFGSETSYVVWNKNGQTIFAFAVAGFELFKTPNVS